MSPFPIVNTTPHTTTHPNLHNAIIDVKGHFGAVGDGIADDTTPIQNAFNQVNTARGGVVVFPPGTYKVSSTLLLPDANDSGNPDRWMSIIGLGATLTTTAAITIIGRRNPTSYSPDAVQMTSWKFVIEGLRFTGTSTAGQVGLDLIATFGSHVKDCSFKELATGLRLTYALMTRVVDCFEEKCVTYGFHARSGDGVFTGGTTSNSGSNHSSFYQCRSQASTGETAQFRIQASSGVTLQDCITEGLNSVEAIHYTGDSTSNKNFRVSNLHSENTPTGSVVRLDLASGGHAIIEQIWHSPTGATLVDGTGSNASSMIVVRDIPWMPTGTVFNKGTSTAAWTFSNIHQDNSYDPTASANWVAATVPAKLFVDRNTAVGGTTTRYVNVNGELHTDTTYLKLTKTGAAFSTPTGAFHGFNGAAIMAKPTVTGSRGGNAALADLLTKLASYGLITDSTSV